MLFKDDHRIELKRKQSFNRSTESNFAKGIKSELEKLHLAFSEKDISPFPDSILVINNNGGLDAGKPVFMSDPECGWVLAANITARNLFASILPEIPTSKYLLARNPDLPENYWSTQPKRLDRDSFNFSLIQMFSKYISQLAADIEHESLLKQALKSIYKDLETLLNLGQPEPALTTLDLTTPILPGLLVFDINGRDIRLPLKKAKVIGDLNFSELFVKQPYVFNNIEEGGLKAIRNVWPLLGKAWGKFELPEPDRMFQATEIIAGTEDSRGRFRIENFEINFKGLGLVEFNQRDIGWSMGANAVSLEIPHTDIDFGLAIWPDFEMDDWKYYVANVFFPPFGEIKDFDYAGNTLKGIAKTELTFVFYGEPEDGSEYREIGVCKNWIPVKLQGKPRCVEIRVDDNPIGSIPIILRKIPVIPPVGPCSIALDFGTSNSCCAISITDTNDGSQSYSVLGILPGDTSVVDNLLKMGDNIWIYGEFARRTLKDPLFWFTAFQDSEAESRRATSIPSELIGFNYMGQHGQSTEEKGNKQLAKGTAYDKNLIVQLPKGSMPNGLQRPAVTPLWTILAPKPKGTGADELESLLSSIKEWLKYHRDNFKWPSRFMSDIQPLLRAMYLEQLLVSVSAALRLAGLKSLDALVATYPGAFSEKERTSYENDLSKITNHVFLMTGMNLDSDKSKVKLNIKHVTETISALRESDRQASEATITIDMGGGTTDIGIILPNYSANNDNEWLEKKIINIDGESKLFSYMSSIRYAGNNLINAICFSPHIQHSLGAIKVDEHLPSTIKFLVREGSVVLRSDQLSHIATAYFEGLFEYVLNILSAALNSGSIPDDAVIKVFLFGNGFKLFDVFSPNIGSLHALLNNCLKNFVSTKRIDESLPNRIQLMNAGQWNGIDAKLSLAQGALKFLNTGGQELTSQYEAIEKAGHAREAILLPGLTLGDNKTDKAKFTSRESISDNGSLHKMAIDRSEMDKAFPVTWKYVIETGLENRIVNEVPYDSRAELAKYYLQGYYNLGEGNYPTFGVNVLTELAKKDAPRLKEIVY